MQRTVQIFEPGALKKKESPISNSSGGGNSGGSDNEDDGGEIFEYQQDPSKQPSLLFREDDLDTTGKREFRERKELNENEVNIQSRKYFATEHWKYIKRHIKRSRLMIERFGKALCGEMGISNPDSKEAREYYAPPEPRYIEGDEVVFKIRKKLSDDLAEKIGTKFELSPLEILEEKNKTKLIGADGNEKKTGQSRDLVGVGEFGTLGDRVSGQRSRLEETKSSLLGKRRNRSKSNATPVDDASQSEEDDDDDDDGGGRRRKRRHRSDDYEDDGDDDDDEDYNPYNEALKFIDHLQKGRAFTKEDLYLIRMLYPKAFRQERERTESFWDEKATKIHLEHLTNRAHAGIRSVIKEININCTKEFGGTTATEMIMAEDETVFTYFVKACAAFLVQNQVTRVSIRTDKTIMDLHKATIHECMFWSQYLYRVKDRKTGKYSILLNMPEAKSELESMKQRRLEINYMRNGGSQPGLERMRAEWRKKERLRSMAAKPRYRR